MTRPDLTVALVRALSALQEAKLAAVQKGDRDLADAIHEEAIRVLKLIGKVATGRPVEAVS